MATKSDSRETVRRLDDAACETLRKFVDLLGQLRQEITNYPRTKHGLFSSGSVSNRLVASDEIKQLIPKVESLAKSNDDFPGMREMRAKHEMFKEAWRKIEDCPEGRAKHDFASRSQRLEEIHAESGMLKAVLEIIIALIGYDWTPREQQAVGRGDQIITELFHDDNQPETPQPEVKKMNEKFEKLEGKINKLTKKVDAMASQMQQERTGKGKRKPQGSQMGAIPPSSEFDLYW